MNKIYKYVLVILMPLLPTVSYGAGYFEKSGGILGRIKDIVNDTLIPLAFLCALLFFFWGVAQYIRNAGEAKDEAKKVMTWGVIALFVMSSVWGLVTVLRSELGINVSEDPMKIPKLTN